ncbi:hypothetical protein PG985_013021 [Apiospora marii]|uniref:uncharacterized protein n=1 Tax=Apiospora marii TaxID=335849 RepID=UPI0031303212
MPALVGPAPREKGYYRISSKLVMIAVVVVRGARQTSSLGLHGDFGAWQIANAGGREGIQDELGK